MARRNATLPSSYTPMGSTVMKSRHRLVPMCKHPAALATWIEANPRDQAMDKHGFILKIGKWNERVSHLPGTPLLGEDGGTGLGLVSRGGLFHLAGPARDDDTGVAALHLFWQSLAWGTGNSHRNTPGRNLYHRQPKRRGTPVAGGGTPSSYRRGRCFHAATAKPAGTKVLGSHFLYQVPLLCWSRRSRSSESHRRCTRFGHTL